MTPSYTWRDVRNIVLLSAAIYLAVGPGDCKNRLERSLERDRRSLGLSQVQPSTQEVRIEYDGKTLHVPYRDGKPPFILFNPLREEAYSRPTRESLDSLLAGGNNLSDN